MFTVEEIEAAHSKVRSGADFPAYIQELRILGVNAFETWVTDSRTDYFGANNYKTSSQPKYESLNIADTGNAELFKHYLKIHQNGETDYLSFCKHCAETGIEKWIVSLTDMTCIYYDKVGNQILVEQIPE